MNKVTPTRVNLEVTWYDGVMKLNVREIRVGDRVKFTQGRGYDAFEVIGTVIKVNKRTVHVRQDNDEHRLTQAAFGRPGGRRVGGKGSMWRTGVSASGETMLELQDPKPVPPDVLKWSARCGVTNAMIAALNAGLDADDLAACMREVLRER